MKKVILVIWIMMFIAAINFGLSTPSSYANATVTIEDCQKDSDFCKNTGFLELSFTGTYRMQLSNQIHIEMNKNNLVKSDNNHFTFKSAFVRSSPVIIHNDNGILDPPTHN